MKRSKTILGITTALLAIVAFTAAKVAKFGRTTLGFYTGSNHNCTSASGFAYATEPLNGAKQAKNGTHFLYSYAQFTACRIPLWTAAKD